VPGLSLTVKAAVYLGSLIGGGIYGEWRFLRSPHGAEVAERRRAAQ
jgi:hypothetical protein